MQAIALFILRACPCRASSRRFGVIGRLTRKGAHQRRACGAPCEACRCRRVGVPVGGWRRAGRFDHHARLGRRSHLHHQQQRQCADAEAGQLRPPAVGDPQGEWLRDRHVPKPALRRDIRIALEESPTHARLNEQPFINDQGDGSQPIALTSMPVLLMTADTAHLPKTGDGLFETAGPGDSPGPCRLF